MSAKKPPKKQHNSVFKSATVNVLMYQLNTKFQAACTTINCSLNNLMVGENGPGLDPVHYTCFLARETAGMEL